MAFPVLTNQGLSVLVGGFEGTTASRCPITVRDFEVVVSSSEMTLLILRKTALRSFGPLARFSSMQRVNYQKISRRSFNCETRRA